MKMLLTTLLVGLSAVFFTGCATANYNQDYISKGLKPELKKVNKNICINEKSLKVINISKFTRGTRLDIDYSVSDINKKVLVSYFKQYFTDVNNVKKECFITVNSEIEYIDTDFVTIDGMNSSFKMNLNITKNKKEIVKMNLDETYSSEVLFTLVLASSPYETGNESFHKGLLDIYETKVEKELLKALRKNL